MSNILDLAEVYNTGTVSRRYLVPWIKEKLGLKRDYIIVNDNLLSRELPEVTDYSTVVLDVSHNPVYPAHIQSFVSKYPDKKIIVLSDDAREPFYTSYFHMPYSSRSFPTYDDLEVKHKFSCLNSVPKIHRLIFLNKLYSMELQNDVYHSFLWDTQQHAKNHLETDYWKNDITGYSIEYSYFITNLKKLCPIQVDTQLDDSVYVNDHSIDSPAYSQTAVNIITESSTERMFFTEKTWKPIYAKQMFLSINAPGSIKKLEQFGFDVFSDLIDHSYDTEHDLVKRIEMCMQEVSRLSKDILQIYKSTKERRHKNFMYLQSKEFKQNVEIRL